MIHKNHKLATKIKQLAKTLGFDLTGITFPIIPHISQTRFQEALTQKRHANLSYLERNLEKRLDPKFLMPETKSIIVLGMNYFNKSDNRISIYAQGDDYHKILKDRSFELIKKLNIEKHKYRVFVDTAPVMEKILAQNAGLGWLVKNTLLINPKYGSFLSLAVIYTDLELPTDEPFSEDLCLNCNKCVKACPTKALQANKLNVEKCISYLTIEAKTSSINISSPYIYGCDICQKACPYNQNIPITKEKAFLTRACYLDDLENWTEEDFNKNTKNSAIARIGFLKWQKNLILGNNKKI